MGGLSLDYLGSLPIDPLLLQCCENGKCFLKYSGIGSGARIAMLNVVKQVVSRVDSEYTLQIETKEMRWRQKKGKQVGNGNGTVDDVHLSEDSDTESEMEIEEDDANGDSGGKMERAESEIDVEVKKKMENMEEDDIEFIRDVD